MAKKRRHYRAKPTISLAVAAGLAPLAITTVQAGMEQGARGIPHNLIMKLSGWDYWDKKWSSTQLMEGVGPIMAGWLVHTGANWLGINRMLARARIPLIRI